MSKQPTTPPPAPPSARRQAALVALYAALLGALELPLTEVTRRALRGAACALARDLEMPPPRP